jgi:ribonuclease P protein component
MINKKYKIDFYKNHSFFRTFNKEKTSSFSIFYQKTKDSTPKIGVIIPKKSVKLKVDRNLIKRRILSIFKTNLENLENLEIVVVAFSNIKHANFQELEDNFLSSLKIIKNK